MLKIRPGGTTADDMLFRVKSEHITGQQGSVFLSSQSLRNKKTTEISYHDSLLSNQTSKSPQKITESKNILTRHSACLQGVYYSRQNCEVNRVEKRIQLFYFNLFLFKIYIFIFTFCESWSLTLREEHRLRVFETGVLRRIFGPKRDEVTGEWRKLHEELKGL